VHLVICILRYGSLQADIVIKYLPAKKNFFESALFHLV